VALETEKALTESKDKVRELEKEVIFINRNRKDLELVVHGVQEHNTMLERELTTLRAQLQGGTFSGISPHIPAPTIGSTLAKMRSSRGEHGSQSSGGRIGGG